MSRNVALSKATRICTARLSRVKRQSSPARRYKFGCVCSYMAGVTQVWGYKLGCVWSVSFRPHQGKKSCTTTMGPLFSLSVARPRGHRAKKAMVYTIFLRKQGKRVYTIGPERRVYTIEPQTRKKKKRRVSTVVVYTFFFPAHFALLKQGCANSGGFGTRCPKDPAVLKILRDSESLWRSAKGL